MAQLTELEKKWEQAPFTETEKDLAPEELQRYVRNLIKDNSELKANFSNMLMVLQAFQKRLEKADQIEQLAIHNNGETAMVVKALQELTDNLNSRLVSLEGESKAPPNRVLVDEKTGQTVELTYSQTQLSFAYDEVQKLRQQQKEMYEAQMRKQLEELAKTNPEIKAQLDLLNSQTQK